jgi:hypothetical protein
MIRSLCLALKSKNRSHKLAWVSILFLVACFGLPRAVYPSPPAAPEAEGQAALLFKVDHKHDFSFSAKLALPRVPTNRGQYSVWIMVGELKGSLEIPAIVQSGLLW